jgi:hypothetical protein
LEQLNIEGKRSGEGFVAHRDGLVSALARAQSAKVSVVDVTLGRKGFLTYLKALSGSNIVKVVPDSGDGASAERPAEKSLKVVCGPNTGHLVDGAWTTEKMAFADICEVRVSPRVVVVPNVGALELAEALARVIPFAARGKEATDKPVLGSVRFGAADGKLTLVSADGFRLGTLALDYADGEGVALIPADEAKGLVSALRKARRVRVGFDADEGGLVVETECICYRLKGVTGTYPDYEALIPSEGFGAQAQFDSREALKAVASLSALSLEKDVGLRLSVNGGVTLSRYGEEGEATIEAETSGEMVIGVNSVYLRETLKALGGMAEVKLPDNPSGPMVFAADGLRAVVMPMVIPQKPETAEGGEAVAVEAQETETAEAPTETAQEPAQDKPKRKRRKAKEPVGATA